MVRSYLVVFFCQVCAAVAAVATLRWLAVYVDPETYGRYVLYQSVVSSGALVVVSWPNTALLRYGREEWTRYRRAGETLAARLFLFGIALMVASATAWSIDPLLRGFLSIDGSPVWWVVAGLSAMAVVDLTVYLSQALGHVEMYGYSPLIRRAGFFVGVALIPFWGTGHNWTYLASCLIASATAASTFVLASLPSTCWSGFRLKSRHVVTILRYSWTLPFAGISMYVINWIDSWFIRADMGVGPVGVYNWAYQAMAIASLAFSPIAVVLAPRLIDARLARDFKAVGRFVDAILPLVSLATVAIAVALVIVFPALQSIATPSYAGAYPVILTLLCALPFQLISYLLTPIANAYESVLSRFTMINAAIALLNALGDFWLVPRIGILGAAVSTTTAFAIGALLQVVIVSGTGVKFAPLWAYLAPAVILLPAVVALEWMGPGTGGLVILGGVAMIGVLLVVRACLFHRRRPSLILLSTPLFALGSALMMADRPRDSAADGGANRLLQCRVGR